jgi:hypothetical protein
MLAPYSLRAMWGDPAASLDEAVDSNLKLMRCLVNCDRLFGDLWTSQARSRKTGQPRYIDRPLSPTKRAILVEVSRRRQSQRVETGGYPLLAHTSGPPSEQVWLYTRFGSVPMNERGGLPNHIGITIPQEGVAPEHLMEPTTALRMLECVVTVASPVWGVLDHPKIASKEERSTRMDAGVPDVGWLTYLRVPPKSLPELPPSATTFGVGAGSIIRAFPSRLDPDNPTHAEAIAMTRAALQNAGLLEPVQYWARRRD